MNTFYVDDPVSSFLEHCSNNRNPIEGVKVNTTSRMMMFGYVDKNRENRSLAFNLEEDTFSLHSNGHFLGKFSYDGSKVVAKWPNRLTKIEKNTIIREIQEFFRRIE